MSITLGNSELGLIADWRSWSGIRCSQFSDASGTARDVQIGPVLLFWFSRRPTRA